MIRYAQTADLRFLDTECGHRGTHERPAQMLRIGGNIAAKNLVRKVAPEYPADARQPGDGSDPDLAWLDGNVKNMKVESGPPELIESALAAVKQWEYKQTLLNGKPIYRRTRIDIIFTLSR